MYLGELKSSELTYYKFPVFVSFLDVFNCLNLPEMSTVQMIDEV